MRFSILILFSLLKIGAFAQTDSVLQDIQSKPDSTQARLYALAAKESWRVSWARVDSLAVLSFYAASRSGLEEMQAESALVIATANRYADAQRCFQWSDSCLYHAARIKNLMLQGGAYRMKAFAFTKINKFEEALQSFYSARKLFEQGHDTLRMIDICLDLSLHYHNQIKDYETGKRYGLEGIKLIEKAKTDYRLWFINNAVAINYDDNNEPEEALRYHYRNLNAKFDSAVYSDTYNNIGNTLLKTGKAKEALTYFTTALRLVNKFAVEPTVSYDYATVYNNLSCVYAELGQWKLSEALRDSAIHYAHASHNMEKLYDAYRDASVNSERNGKYKESIVYLKRYMELKDSVFSVERAKAIGDFEVQYETQKKESEIALLKSDSTIKDLRIKQAQDLAVIIIIGALLIGLLVFYLIKRRSQADKIQRALENEEHQRKQFASVLEGGEKERIRIAKELHDGVGQLLSIAKLSLTGIDAAPGNEILLSNATQTLDEATREVREVSHNLMPAVLSQLGLSAALRDFVEKINRSGKVIFQLDVAGLETRLTDTSEIHIYRILQEVTNNILKHSTAKVVTINIQNSDDRVSIKVEDDGNPMDEKVLRSGKGLGWKNILSRVSMLDGKINLSSGQNSGNMLHIELLPNGR